MDISRHAITIKEKNNISYSSQKSLATVHGVHVGVIKKKIRNF